MCSLPSGAVMPMCGLGTFKSKGEDCTAACVAALQAGYRLIDTARVYRNEAAVGAALRLAQDEGQGLPREEVFLTTKIPPTEQGEEAAYAAVLSSLQQLDVKYIDLVLLHWPGKAKTPLNSPLNQQARRGSWAALIRARREGLVRDIGVSNFTQAHLEDVCFQSPQCDADLASCCLPAVNQVECHPLCPQLGLRAFCAQRHIVLQAYSSMCSGEASVFAHPAMQALLTSVAEASGGAVSSPQQLLLLWGLQQRLPVIPKSSSPDRVRQNWQFMERWSSLPPLPTDCLAELRGEGEGGGDRHLCWDPHKVL